MCGCRDIELRMSRKSIKNTVSAHLLQYSKLDISATVRKDVRKVFTFEFSKF